MLEHAGHLDDAPQLHLSPTAAHGGLAQRFHEVRRLAVQPRQVRLDEAAKLLVERRVRVLARALHLAELAVDFRERFTNRLHERVDCFLARLEVAVRAFLKLLERRGRELQEALVARAQRFGGQRLERVRELALRRRGQIELGGCRAQLFVGARLRLGQLFARLPAEGPGGREAEGQRWESIYKECLEHGGRPSGCR